MTTTKTKPTLKAAKQRLFEFSTEELEKCLTMTTATDAEKQCVLQKREGVKQIFALEMY